MSSRLKSQLEKTVSTKDGIVALLVSMGYPLLSDKEQLLDSDVLFQQKDMRGRVMRSYKLFSQKAQWLHPVSKQAFDTEATIMLFELVDEQTLRSRWPFEITRYVVRFGLRSAQGLFFFVAPNSRSFVVSAYTESLDVPERVQVRRLVVDVDNVARTDIESLSELLYSLVTPATIIERFRSALPYLKVGQAFFKEYHNLFQILSKRLLEVFGSKAKAEAYGYAQRLLGRITFLYFLQRKGWLDKDGAYLKKRTKGLDGKSLFRFLHELFDILNTEGYEDKSKGIIPYLNGSLFEKEPYSQSQMKQLMDACTPCIRDVLDVFDQYNFTISESTPLDKEVAVDPELLGSLFESMLPEAERGDKGTFYTHQEEMLFMAREALRVYLSRFSNLLNQEQVFHLVYGLQLSEKEKIEPRAAREVKDVLRQIKILDPAVGSGGFLMAALQIILEVRARLNGIIGAMEQTYDVKLEAIENNLFGVDIENEAIELARLRLWLALVVDESIGNVRPLPNLDYNLHQGDSLKIPEFEKRRRQTKITVDPALRAALLKQIAATREEYSRSHGRDKESRRIELENALRKLLELESGTKAPKILPFSYKHFFADIMAAGGFDAVLMNPPYIRQEDIGKLPGQNPDTYKHEVIEDLRSLTEDRFHPKKQSDIAVYFHVRSLSLLKNGGIAVVIATSKWLDVVYGGPLQEYLLTTSKLECIYDSAERSFAADVNTVITVTHKMSIDIDSNLVKFVYFKIPFGQVTGDILKEIYEKKSAGIYPMPQYRVASISQSELYATGLSAEDNEDRKETDKVRHRKTYEGTKWGNLYLRAPEVFFQILEKSKGILKPLKTVVKLKRGFTTGCDDFFIVKSIEFNKEKRIVSCKNGFGLRFKLEADFCRPLLNFIGDISGVIDDVDSFPFRVFLCQEPKNKIKGTYALRYIEWGESSPDAMVVVPRGKEKGKKKPIYAVATVRGRERWYSLPTLPPTRLWLTGTVKNRHIIPYATKPFLSDHSQYAVYCENEAEYWLFFSSSVFRLFMELYGETQGAGALYISVADYKKIPVPSTISLSRKFKELDSFKARPVYRLVNIAKKGPLELEQQDRLELDDKVLESLGFTDATEREKALRDIHNWLKKRVLERLLKPKTAPESVSKAIGRKRFQTDLREFQ
jgi:methylase of polypeptide subunit release factors